MRNLQAGVKWYLDTAGGETKKKVVTTCKEVNIVKFKMCNDSCELGF